MKPMIAIRLLGPLTVVLGAALPAWAQTTDFTKWLCEIDLSDLGRPSEFTIDTKKHCPGNDPTQCDDRQLYRPRLHHESPLLDQRRPVRLPGYLLPRHPGVPEH
jgi:hypothetical protein